MCCESETEARPCGLINRVRARLSGPAEPDPEPARPAWLDDEEEMKRRASIAHHQHAARCLAEGVPLCARCEQPLDPVEREDGGPLHPAWCWTCSQMWVEEAVLAPLVDRLGRRGARRALRRLVSEVKRLV
jgi:hypothetical protein